MTPARPRLTVGRRGCSAGLSRARIKRLGADYRTRPFAHLPGFFEGDLLDWAMDALDATDFLSPTAQDHQRYLKALAPTERFDRHEAVVPAQ